MQVRSKYWMSLAIAILLALAVSDVMAEGNEYTSIIKGVYADDPLTAHAMCAAWNVTVAERMEDVFSKTVIMAEASRHNLIVRHNFDEHQVKYLYGELFDVIQAAYNSGDVSWIDLVNAAESCREI